MFKRFPKGSEGPKFNWHRYPRPICTVLLALMNTSVTQM